MTCPKCGVEYEGDVCPSCGISDSGKVKCKSCGALISIGTVVCPKCGNKAPEHFCTDSKERIPVNAHAIWSIASGLLSLVCSVCLFIDTSIALHIGGLAVAPVVLGVVASILLMLGGVVSVMRYKSKRQSSVLLVFIYGVCSLLCLVLMFVGPFIESSIFAWWCLICTVVALVSSLRS